MLDCDWSSDVCSSDLRLGRHGLLELEAGQISITQLPFSSWAEARDTALVLERGSLRVLWQQPAGRAESWPLSLRLGRWRTALGNGDFYFRVDQGTVLGCSSLGPLALQRDDSATEDRLDPPSCLSLRAGEAPQALPIEVTGRRLPPVAPPAAASPAPVNVVVPVLRSDLGLAGSQPLLSSSGPSAPPSAVPPQPAAVPPQPAAVPPPVIVATESSTGPAVSPADATALPAPAPPPLAGPEWIVNILTVSDRAQADEHVRRLTAAGYPATLREETVRGRSSFRVVIVSVPSEQGAQRLAKLVAEQLGYRGAWALQKR
jgi:cell division septation protein DedD